MSMTGQLAIDPDIHMVSGASLTPPEVLKTCFENNSFPMKLVIPIFHIMGLCNNRVPRNPWVIKSDHFYNQIATLAIIWGVTSPFDQDERISNCYFRFHEYPITSFSSALPQHPTGGGLLEIPSQSGHGVRILLSIGGCEVCGYPKRLGCCEQGGTK